MVSDSPFFSGVLFLGLFGIRSRVVAGEVDRGGGLPIQGCVAPFGVVEVEVAVETGVGFATVSVVPQGTLFVLHGPPQPSNELFSIVWIRESGGDPSGLFLGLGFGRWQAVDEPGTRQELGDAVRCIDPSPVLLGESKILSP